MLSGAGSTPRASCSQGSDKSHRQDSPPAGRGDIHPARGSWERVTSWPARFLHAKRAGRCAGGAGAASIPFARADLSPCGPGTRSSPVAVGKAPPLADTRRLQNMAGEPRDNAGSRCQASPGGTKRQSWKQQKQLASPCFCFSQALPSPAPTARLSRGGGTRAAPSRGGDGASRIPKWRDATQHRGHR